MSREQLEQVWREMQDKLAQDTLQLIHKINVNEPMTDAEKRFVASLISIGAYFLHQYLTELKKRWG